MPLHSSLVVRLALAGCGAILLLSGGARADEQPPASASVSATAAVAPVGMPDKAGGLRDLRFAWGDGAADFARAAVIQGLVEIHAFDSVGLAGGPYALELRLTKVKQTSEDLHDDTNTALTFTVDAAATWRAGDRVVHEGPLHVEQRRTVDHPPWKRDLAAGWGDALAVAGQRAFSDAWPEAFHDALPR